MKRSSESAALEKKCPEDFRMFRKVLSVMNAEDRYFMRWNFKMEINRAERERLERLEKAKDRRRRAKSVSAKKGRAAQ